MMPAVLNMNLTGGLFSYIGTFKIWIKNITLTHDTVRTVSDVLQNPIQVHNET